MKKEIACLCILALGSLAIHGQGNTVSFIPVRDLTSSAIERNGLPGPSVDSGTNYDLFQTNYGAIATGNTISRCEFIATMEVAYDGGYGGVYDFEDVNASYDTTADPLFPTKVDWIRLDESDADGILVVPGALNWVENQDYRGKETALFDGTGPSPMNVKRDSLYISANANVAGKALVNTTSYDLDFDPADEVSVVGWAYLNANDFQSYQRGNQDYPNVHATVLWTNGVDSVEQMAVQYSAQSASVDAFFGFKQPAAGYYLDYLRMYVIGNTWRTWIGLDELGIAVGDGAAVELDTPVAIMPNSGEVAIPVTTDCMYQLQTSTDLSTWIDQGDPVVPIADGDQTWTTTPPAAGQKVFYRVQVP